MSLDQEQSSQSSSKDSTIDSSFRTSEYEDDSPGAFSVVLGTANSSTSEDLVGLISILIIDEEGRQTDRTVLRFSHTHSSPFSKGHSDLFVISHQPSLGNLESVQIFFNGRDDLDWKLTSCYVFHHELGKIFQFSTDEKSSTHKVRNLQVKEEPLQIIPPKLDNPFK